MRCALPSRCRRSASSRLGARARHRASRRCSCGCAASGPPGAGRAASGRPRCRDGVHLPQPGSLHRPHACRCPELDRSSSPRGRISPTTSQRGPPALRPGSLATPGSTTTARCGPGLRSIAGRLRAAGERALAFADDNAIVDREVAYLGGLGWFGKNANLLVAGAGSWFVLGSVVTTASFDAELAEAPVADGCGSCRRCIDMCPTGAIVAPGVIDGRRCLAWVLQRPGSIPVELRTAVGDRIYGCDDCQEACPPTVRLGRRHVRPLGEFASASHRGVQAWVDVLDLLDADDDTLLHRHGRWYIAGRDPRWLRRNALVVLGNVGDGADGARRRLSLGTGTVTTTCSPSTPGGRATGSGCPGVTTDRVADARREAPVGDERLPAEDRRDPVAAVGVVAASAAGVVRRADQPVCRGGGIRRRPAVPRRAGARAGAAAPSADGAADQLPWPARSVPRSSCSTRRCRSGSSGRRWSCPTTSWCTVPRSPCRAGCRELGRRSPRCCAGPQHRVGGGVRRPRGRARRRPGRCR